MFDSGKLYKIFNSTEDYKLPVYFICEIGINHQGSVETAIELIQEAKNANVDAVKFQKRNLDHIYTSEILENSNNSEWNFDYIIPILKEVELAEDDYKLIRNKCDELELDLIITPFDKLSANFAHSVGISAFKIASADMTNYDLVEYCNQYKLPIIVSTGIWSKEEIEKSYHYYQNKGIHLALLLAQSTYPCPYKSINLGFLNELKKLSNIIGYSGHEREDFIPLAAVALGCKIIEKHITLNKNQKGPDHKASMLPNEWKEMIRKVRLLELAMGNDKIISEAEKLNKQVFAKSAIAISNLEYGHILKKEDIDFKSPGKGIFQHEISEYYGKPLTKSIKKNNYISKEDFFSSERNWNQFKFNNKWGVKYRFHDFDDSIPCSSIEFHCSYNDIISNYIPKNISNKELIVHAPEIFDKELFNLCEYNSKFIDILHKTIDKTLHLHKYFANTKPKIVVHIGGMSSQKTNIDYRKLVDIAIKNFKSFEQYKNLIDILPENLPPKPWYFGGEWYQNAFCSSEDMMYFCKYYNLGMTFDICHASLYCRYTNKNLLYYIDSILPIIKHLHISDAIGVDGEGIQINNGQIDFDKSFALLNNSKFSWVTEIWSGHLYDNLGCYTALQRLNKYNIIL